MTLARMAPSVSLGTVAEAESTNSPRLVRILRTIVRHGHARPVAKFLREEGDRIARRGTQIVYVGVSLAAVAAEESLSAEWIDRMLRTIARHGLAQAVETFLLEEELRQSNEIVRKEEQAARFRRKYR